MTSRRLIREKGGITYKETSEEEARFAVHLGHHLMVRLLEMQNRYFALGFDDEVKKRVDAFVAVWGIAPASPPQSEQDEGSASVVSAVGTVLSTAAATLADADLILGKVRRFCEANF